MVIAFFLTQVSTNGVLSFRTSFFDFTPELFPLSVGCPDLLIAPFWDVSDNGVGGQVYYRLSHEPSLLDQIAINISDAFGVIFSPTSSFVATWNVLPQFTGPFDVVNKLKP